MSENNSRRAFLGRSAVATGGMVLALSHIGKADDAVPAKDAAAKTDETVLKLSEHADLAKVGGFEVVDTDAGKVIVIHVEADKFVACSAVCTHRGCTVGYEAEAKEIVCPCHGARFDLDGTVKHGPAKLPLQSYSTGAAAVVTLKKQ